MIFFAAKISAQQLQRYESIELQIACLINCAHSTNTQSLNDVEMIECPLDPYFLATRWTGDARQWLGICRIDSRPASGACLSGRLTRHWATIVTFAFQKETAEENGWLCIGIRNEPR
jgi:hypothetical protein